MGKSLYTEAKKECNERYRKKFWRPTVYFDKEKEAEIRKYAEDHGMSVNEFFAKAADKLLAED